MSDRFRIGDRARIAIADDDGELAVGQEVAIASLAGLDLPAGMVGIASPLAGGGLLGFIGEHQLVHVLCATCSGAERDDVDASVRCARCRRLLDHYLAVTPPPFVGDDRRPFDTRREAEAYATAQGPRWTVIAVWGDPPHA